MGHYLPNRRAADTQVEQGEIACYQPTQCQDAKAAFTQPLYQQRNSDQCCENRYAVPSQIPTGIAEYSQCAQRAYRTITKGANARAMSRSKGSSMSRELKRSIS